MCGPHPPSKLREEIIEQKIFRGFLLDPHPLHLTNQFNARLSLTVELTFLILEHLKHKQEAHGPHRSS